MVSETHKAKNNRQAISHMGNSVRVIARFNFLIYSFGSSQREKHSLETIIGTVLITLLCK